MSHLLSHLLVQIRCDQRVQYLHISLFDIPLISPFCPQLYRCLHYLHLLTYCLVWRVHTFRLPVCFQRRLRLPNASSDKHSRTRRAKTLNCQHQWKRRFGAGQFYFHIFILNYHDHFTDGVYLFITQKSWDQIIVALFSSGSAPRKFSKPNGSPEIATRPIKWKYNTSEDNYTYTAEVILDSCHAS